MSPSLDCDICSRKADMTFKRIEVWSDETWRLTMSTYSMVKGLCYVEPKRHIEDLTELDGKEADEFGNILSSISKAIKKATGAKLVYVYIYGDHIPHLHVHLAPHKDGDVFYNDVIKNDIEFKEELMPLETVTDLKNAIRGALK